VRRMGLRRPTLVVPAACLVAALAFAACGNSSNVTTLNSPPTTDTSLTLTLQRSPEGPILATGAGNTLYDFVPDTPMHSACVNTACVFQWPPLVKSGPIEVGQGLNTALVGTLARPDGSTQISYGGHPLYTYNMDVTPGMVTGQAVDQDGGLWYVINAQGKQITTSFAVTNPNLNVNPNT
jgi:predicted lipoprotein with Yx(FWY)xxD motif